MTDWHLVPVSTKRQTRAIRKAVESDSVDRGRYKRWSSAPDSIGGVSTHLSVVQHKVHICLTGRIYILIAQAAVLIGCCLCHPENIFIISPAQDTGFTMKINILFNS